MSTGRALGYGLPYGLPRRTRFANAPSDPLPTQTPTQPVRRSLSCVTSSVAVVPSFTKTRTEGYARTTRAWNHVFGSGTGAIACSVLASVLRTQFVPGVERMGDVLHRVRPSQQVGRLEVERSEVDRVERLLVLAVEGDADEALSLKVPAKNLELNGAVAELDVGPPRHAIAASRVEPQPVPRPFRDRLHRAIRDLRRHRRRQEAGSCLSSAHVNIEADDRTEHTGHRHGQDDSSTHVSPPQPDVSSPMVFLDHRRGFGRANQNFGPGSGGAAAGGSRPPILNAQRLSPIAELMY